MTKRAFVLYNDNINGAVSVLAELKDDSKWRTLDQDMEEVVGDLRTVKEIQAAVLTFPAKFADVQFHEANVYAGFKSTEISAVTLEAENEFLGPRTGYKMHNPERTPIEFAA